MGAIFAKIRSFWPLIKYTQTGLLLATGLAGYFGAHSSFHPSVFVGMCASLFLAISGSTILNMWYDRDIDRLMGRTRKRPLSTGTVTDGEALWVGLAVSALGIGGAFALQPAYGLVVFAGLFFDVVVYTIWLKRRTCWSIVWGGISGGMPILAGRVLATGQVDMIGILLTMAILFWIPTHTLTFSMHFVEDYRSAGVPTFPSTYGVEVTRALIALSAIIAAACVGVAGVMIGVQAGSLRLIAVLSTGLLLLSMATLTRPSDRVNFGLFKYASVYMLASMILLSI